IYAVVVAHRRIVRRRHANSNTSAHADASAHADTNTDTEPGPGMQRGSDLDRDRDLHWRPAREPERRHLRSQVVDSKPESGDQLRPGRPLAAYWPLRHADGDADANSYADSGAYTDPNAAADRVAQDNHILHTMGHLRPQLQGEGHGHHRDGEQVDAHPLRL